MNVAEYAYAVQLAVGELRSTSNPWGVAARDVWESTPPVILTGLGKSGLVAQRAAATWNSLGLPSTYVHPVDGLHGDLRVMNEQSAVVAVSWSGHTREVEELCKLALAQGAWRVVMVSACDCIHTWAHVNINLPSVVEPMPPAPMVASVVQATALDMLAVEVMSRRYSEESFRRWHRGGVIGEEST